MGVISDTAKAFKITRNFQELNSVGNWLCGSRTEPWPALIIVRVQLYKVLGIARGVLEKVGAKLNQQDWTESD